MAEYAYVGPVAHSSGTGNLPIHRIVIHCTASTTDAGSALGTARYFRDPAATGSAHAITDPNQLVICATDDVVCWHAPPNPHSIGIEIECSLAGDGKGHWTLASHQQMMHRAAKWVAEKCKLHGIPVRKLTVAQLQANPAALGICGHVDVTNAFHQSTHTDPGPYFPWSQFIGYVQTEYAALGGTQPPPPPSSTEDDAMLSPEAITQLRAAVQIENEEYGARLWGQPTGTGTKFIAATEGGLAAAIDDITAAQADLDAKVATLQAAVDANTAAVSALTAALAPKV